MVWWGCSRGEEGGEVGGEKKHKRKGELGIGEGRRVRG